MRGGRERGVKKWEEGCVSGKGGESGERREETRGVRQSGRVTWEWGVSDIRNKVGVASLRGGGKGDPRGASVSLSRERGKG